MKKQIFYFTGTGNSLAVAREIHSVLEHDGFELKSLLTGFEDAAADEEKNITIVTPIYMYNIPYIVKDFIDSIVGGGQCTVVLNGGGEAGNCFGILKKLFEPKKISLTSIFSIPMPNNYAPFGADSDEEVTQKFSFMKNSIASVCQAIKSGEQSFIGDDTGFFRSFIHPGILYGMGYRYLKFLDKNFYADEKCDSCGICAQVCPVGNIKLESGNPSWLKNCQQCFACLQWCPREAIQYGNKTAGVKRYRHPEVKLSDMIKSKEKQ